MPSPDFSASRPWAALRVIRTLVVAAAVVIFMFLAWRSSPWFSDLRWMPRTFARWADYHGVARNVVGFFGFGLVGFVLAGRRWLHVTAAAVFAIALEVVQLWIPHRIFDPKDIYASLLGLTLAWLVVAGGAVISRRLLPA